MNSGLVAKNLLANKICDNCTFFSKSFADTGNIFVCNKTNFHLPKENTCENWEEAASDVPIGTILFWQYPQQGNIPKGWEIISGPQKWLCDETLVVLIKKE